MQVENSYTVEKPQDGKVTIVTSTGTHQHSKVGLIYVGTKNITVCNLDRQAVARYPRLLVAGISYLRPLTK